jgi:uncharacterized Zn finger protein (UPF0148 family)
MVIYRKNCEKCSRPSFSSSNRGEWICPLCGSDLTDFPFFNAETIDRIQIRSIPIHQKIESYRGSSKKMNT